MVIGYSCQALTLIHVGRDAEFARDDALGLRLVLEELLTNAVHYGHGGDGDQRVDVVLDEASRGGLTSRMHNLIVSAALPFTTKKETPCPT